MMVCEHIDGCWFMVGLNSAEEASGACCNRKGMINISEKT
jgi:hypothetical protein